MIGQSDSWLLYICFSRRVCYDRAMFKTYANEKVSLGVALTTNFVGIWEVEQSPPMKKTLILKKRISSFLLNKVGFSQSIGVDLYTITKNDIFVNEIKNQLRQLRAFVVIDELSMILVYLMNFLNNMELYMKRLHHTLLQWMIKQNERIELLLNLLLQLC